MGQAKQRKLALEQCPDAVLYHFTFSRQLETIVTEGLKPSKLNPSTPRNVVWLTTNPETIYACDQHGNPVEHAHDRRIEIVIPAHDRRLINWERWLRKHAPGEAEFILRNPYLGRERSQLSLQEWHCYFGVLPPSLLREISEIAGGLPARRIRYGRG